MDTAKPSRRRTLSERVAAEIRAEMGRQQIRNAALAELLGENEMWVSRKIRGVTPLTLGEVERIAEVLEVDSAALLAAPPEPSRSGGLSPGSARVAGRPRAARLMEVAHRGGHAPSSGDRTNSDADNTAPIRHSRAPVRLCAGVTR